MELSAEPQTLELRPIPDIAEALGVPVPRVHQYLRDGQLVAVRDEQGVRCIPAQFVKDGAIVKHLSGVVTLLRDAHFTDDEIIGWLFRPDESLPGTPIEALRGSRPTEVTRRAQVAGY